jgi:hypothetical protein
VAKIGGSFGLLLSGTLTVAQAGAFANLLPGVAGGAAISDAAAAVQGALDTLQGYGSGIASIALTDAGTPTVTVDAATLVADAGALGLIGGNWNLAVSSGTVTADQAIGLSAGVTSHLAAGLSVTGGDTELDALQAMGSAVASIAFASNGLSVSLTSLQLVSDAATLAKVTTTYTLAVSGTLTVAQAESLDGAGLLALVAGGGAVSDSAADVQANLDALQAMGGRVGSIALTDGSTPTMTVTAAALLADAATLAAITTPYHLTVSSGTVGAADPGSISNRVIASLTSGLNVSDSAANVTTSLASLQGLAAGGHLGSIALTDGGTPVISLSASTVVSDSPALEAIGGSWSLAVSSGSFTAAQAAALVSDGLAAHLSGQIAVNDSASHLMAQIAPLQQLVTAGALGTVTATTGVSAYNVTVAQFAADSGAINAVMGATGAAAGALLYIHDNGGGDTLDVSAFSRTTDILLGSNSATMSFIGAAATVTGAADVVTLNGSAASTVQDTLGGGTEVINGFQFGEHVLDIALGSASAADLTVTDVTVNSVASVALSVAGDPSHGVILVNPGLTASSIASDHLFAAGSNVLIA